MEFDKQALRRIVAARRREASESELAGMSALITQRILELGVYQKAGMVFSYMDLPGEVQTRALITQCLKDGKRVAIPRLSIPGGSQGREKSGMHFHEIRDFDHLVIGAMNISEPDPSFCPNADREEEALIIMPGTAYDQNLNRVGYGGGFYDRYLERHRHHPTVAVAFDFQIFDAVPHEQTDISPQILVMPHETIYLPR